MQTHDSSPAHIARRVLDEALAGVDAGHAVERAVRFDAGRLHILGDEFDLTGGFSVDESDSSGGEFKPAGRGRRVYSIALGKAAGPMAAALERALGPRLTRGVISAPPLAPDDAPQLSARWRVFAGGHPLPNRASLDAARACFRLLRRANDEAALVVFLVSGGGSAMLEWPRDPSITLDDLREANRALVSCGASIAEVNAVRRAFSAVKGGGLARLAPHAAQVTLIVSDTREGEEQTVASGPTLAPAETQDAPRAPEVVRRYDLAARLPASIIHAVGRRADEEHVKERDEERAAGGAPAEVSSSRGRDSDRLDRPRRHHVLLSNATAVERAAAVARQLGCAVEVADEIADQHVAEGARLLVSRLLELRARVRRESPVCLVSGGEFACPVRGAGLGGRSSETALRCALELEARGVSVNATADHAPRFALLLAGTDGRDGNSPAAGALADETTAARARALRLDPHEFLAESDSHSFFAALGAALHTGHTGTNVRDLRILMAK